MDSQHVIWFYLWIAPHLLLLAVAGAMLRNSYYRQFPSFFLYVLFEFLQFCVLIKLHVLQLPPALYSRVDFVLRCGSVALRFAILQQLFELPLTKHAPLRRVMAPIARWITVLLMALSAVLVVYLYSNLRGLGLLRSYLSVEAFNMAQCGMLVLVFLWYRYLGVRMSAMAFGVALGMGFVVGLEPLIQELKDVALAPNSIIVDYLQMGAFHIAVLVWLLFALARDGVAQSPQHGAGLGMSDARI